MKEDSISQSKLVEQQYAKNLDTVYHYTFEGSVNKIIEFGFDRHLSGQGSIQRHRINKSPKISSDKFVKWVERIPENRVINTCINPEKNKCGDCLLRIKLKPDASLLDAKLVEELTRVRWPKKLSYARQRGYDGILDGNDVFLFSNKKIESIQLVPESNIPN